MTRARALLPTACLALLALAACSDDSPTEPDGPGTPGGRTWRVPGDVATIAAAADSAQPGDAIEVAPGRYREHGIVLDIGVDLRRAPGAAGDVIIDGEGLGRVLAVQQHEDTEAPVDTVAAIADLVITGGDGGNAGGGGLLLEHPADLTGVRFVRNTATGPGGGVRVLLRTGGPVAFSSCAFDTNASTGADGRGGGLAFDGDGLDDLRLDRCGFIGNSSQGRGGGLATMAAGIRVSHCVFRQNRATGYDVGNGGGLSYEGFKNQQAVVDTCTFAGNLSQGDGGGIMSAGRLAATECEFLENEAFRGGGISAGGSYTVVDCTFRDNLCESAFGDDDRGLGGALLCAGSGSVSGCEFTGNHGNLGSAVFGFAAVDLRDCTFTGNASSGSGTVSWVGNAVLGVENCTFVDNGAVSGGVFEARARARVRFSACTLTGNTATQLAGAGLVTDGASATLDTCTVTGNTAALGGAFFVDTSGLERTTLTLAASAVTGNTASETGGAVFVGIESDLVATDTDLRGNAAPTGPAAFVSVTGTGTFTCCDVVQEEVVGPGTITFVTDGCD